MSNSSLPNSDDGSPATQVTPLQLKWQEFISQFPTDADCYAELHKRINDDGEIHCKNCGSHNIRIAYGDRAGNCSSCHKQVAFTANTFFKGIKKPKAWLGAIWLLEQGMSFSAAELRRLAKVAYSTAWNVLTKIGMVIENHLRIEGLAVSVASALFESAICKRSLETPANQHPFAEQVEMEKRAFDSGEEDQCTGMSTASGSRINTAPSMRELQGPEKEAYELLSTEAVQLDELCERTEMPVGKLLSILMILEMEGLIEHMPGDLYCRRAPAVQAQTQEQNGESSKVAGTAIDLIASIAEGIDFIRSNFHGVSRKYLQLFLAIHWCHVERDKWSTGSLLKACSRFRAIKPNEILAFVSPLFVKTRPC